MVGGRGHVAVGALLSVSVAACTALAATPQTLARNANSGVAQVRAISARFFAAFL